MKCLTSVNHRFNLSPFLDKKEKWIDPKVIEIDNSESENDFDFIPPSPTPEEILYFSQTRSVLFIQYVTNSLCLFELKITHCNLFEAGVSHLVPRTKTVLCSRSLSARRYTTPQKSSRRTKQVSAGFSMELEPQLAYVQMLQGCRIIEKNIIITIILADNKITIIQKLFFLSI